MKIYRYLMILLFISCTNKKLVFTELLVGVEVEEGYVYSDESRFELGDKKYFLRARGDYTEEGRINKLYVYKSEGILVYSQSEL